jgi:nitronate monooxygenase
MGGEAPKLPRPQFLAIVASATLATMLKRRSTGNVDGFIVEGHTAGGHNAPPRGKMQTSGKGEPVYGERDIPELKAFRDLGLPFWLAGSYAEPERLLEALDEGAQGIQVGTAFAFCEESGLEPELKSQVLAASHLGDLAVHTDPVASPTGFPFKVVQLEGTVSQQEVYEQRRRICDLGYLRQPYKKDDGSLGWRCPAEPVADYVRKGGDEADTQGRKCICNALVANIGMPQVCRDGELEKPLITSGNDVATVARFLAPLEESYTAADVIEYLLQGVRAAAAASQADDAEKPKTTVV